jgi:TonB family protein
VCRLGLLVALLTCVALSARAVTPELQQALRGSTFEVVMKKPEHDAVVYEKPLPLELLPYQERTDAYRSLGTAFALGNNTYVTAAHVISQGIGTQFGAPALRSSDGKIYTIDRVLKFSRHEDFVVFSLRDDPKPPGLPVNREPKLDDTVLAVGNALGDGIVIRDGLLTSQTPEAQDGRWKWLRFSAAASPGNSGGPLCDAGGRVLGVVVLKSPNENLNYALPIANVLDAEEGKASFDERAPIGLPFLHDTISYSFKDEFKLPLPWGAFVETYRKLNDRHEEEAMQKLLSAHADTFFPKGAGSQNLLFERAHPSVNPRLITQKADGAWVAASLEYSDTQLPGDGSVSVASFPPARIVRIVRPSSASDDAFYSDSKAFMDLALKGLDLRRAVGPDHVRVLSLGAALSEATYTDTYGRRWQQRIWAIPYEDAYLVGLLLPTPDGYSAIIIYTSSITVHAATQWGQLFAAQVDVSYQGTLAQWQAALARRASLPAGLSTLKLEKSPRWALRTGRFFSSVPAQTLPLTEQSPMILVMGFVPDETRTVWDVEGVWWYQDTRRTSAIGLWRRARPPATVELDIRNQFDSIRERRAPFDGSPSRESEGVFSSTHVLDVPGSTPNTVSTDLEYGLTLDSPDYASLLNSSGRLQEISAATQILERGPKGHETASKETRTETPSKTPSQSPARLDQGFAALERQTMSAAESASADYGPDFRGRWLIDDMRDLFTRIIADAAAVTPGSPAAAQRLEEEKQRIATLQAYWTQVPHLKSNRDMWTAFLEHNHLPATTPHSAEVSRAEAALTEALAQPVNPNWVSRASDLRQAYLEERRTLVMQHVPLMDSPPPMLARQSPCPAPVTTPSGTASPRFAHAAHDLEEIYPDASRRLGEEGTVLASVTISPTGCVSAMAIVGSSGSDRLDETVLKYLETVQFIPAGTNGHAVEKTVRLPVVFKLTN